MKLNPTAICCLFVAAMPGVAKAQSVKPPFSVSLHADCWLGSGASEYWVRIDRESATNTRLVFQPKRKGAASTSFVVPGVLSAFESLKGDLVLTFVDPGPTTRAYSEVDGRVRQIFECTSRFGAVPAPVDTPYGGALVCYQGGRMAGNLWLPTVAKIYLRTENGFDLAAKVPYAQIFQTLGKISNEETQKLSGQPRR